MNKLANYHAERAAFKRLFESGCAKRIVMYCGESGSGKTALMEACRELVPTNMPCVQMDLRGSTTNVTEILSRTVVKLGGLQKLPSFSGRLASLSGVPALNLADNTLKGTENQIQVVIHNTAPMERQERYSRLTEAWFDDVEQARLPLLLMLDTFNDANQEVCDWISGPLLGRAADTESLRIVISGKTLPDKRIDWSRCCEVHELYGVREAEHWLPVIEHLGLRVPAASPLDYLAGVCAALNGNPGEILKHIKTFPRKH